MLARTIALLPGQCELCRGWGAGLVCRQCIARHAPPRPRCKRCGLALGVGTGLCGACQHDPPPYARTVCALDYGFPWDRLIAAFKFQHKVEWARAFASLLGEAVRREADLDADLAADRDVDHDGAITPTPGLLVTAVPMAPARLAERGFNQAWELARHLARAMGLRAAPHALQRVLETSPQAGLARIERERNLRNAFAPGPEAARLRGAPVVLVDDVMTTGATAREAAAALLRSGASSVQLWVLARTPDPGRASG